MGKLMVVAVIVMVLAVWVVARATARRRPPHDQPDGSGIRPARRRAQGEP